ncbi:MAG TPA: alpha/beta hydrolase-fold protein [Rhodothermales bacterium]|nr:alpha/beta hydrolase-fold protein [Rhodothermales bacterium]
MPVCDLINYIQAAYSMRSVLLVLFIAILLPIATVAHAQYPRGTVQEGLTIDSKILGKSVRYTIYLPYDYDTSDRYYPVVYLLHGYSDDDTGWLQFGEANAITDELIAERKIPPMILVMPDAGVSWYVNNYDGSVRYEDFFFQEFIPYVESHYRIRAEKQFRAVSGLSMGGYGTLVYALHHPEMFATAAPFSAAIWTDEEIVNFPEDQWTNYFRTVFDPKLQGQARLSPHYRANSPLDLIRQMGADEVKQVRWRIDCGDDDFLYKGNAALHVLMRDLNIPHEYRVRDGGHTWTYWRTGLPGALEFIGAGFRR